MQVEAPTAFLGLSHLGLVSSAGWSSFGQPVIAVDPDAGLVQRLQRGDLPVHEPGLPDLLDRSRETLQFTADLRNLSRCPLVIVSRDVPTDDANVSHIEPVVAVIDEAVVHLAQDVILVVMSQVRPGFTRALGERIQSARPELRFTLYYWVETLIFGDAVRRTLHPERQIVGAADPSEPLAEVFLRGLERYACPILPMGYESAELTKTAINLYLIGSVTYANSMADLCEAVGANWAEMTPALRLDKRIGQAAYIRPGLGIAGGNLERDLVTLSELGRQGDVDLTYLDALTEHNARRFEWVLRKVRATLTAGDAAQPPRLALWGLTYKKNTRSTKNSPALRLIETLSTASARVDICAWDPVISASDLDLSGEAGRRVTFANSAADALDGAAVLVIAADWDHFGAVELSVIKSRLRCPVVIDCVGILDARAAVQAGIQYHGMGHG